jgi:hypothetical protein
MSLLSLRDVCGCDLTFGLAQSTCGDPRRDRLRQFPVVTRFDTLWAGHCLTATGSTRPVAPFSQDVPKASMSLKSGRSAPLVSPR